MLNLPAAGAAITSQVTGNTYLFGDQMGGGNFGVVFECSDVWDNRLVAKILRFCRWT